MSDISYPKE